MQKIEEVIKSNGENVKNQVLMCRVWCHTLIFPIVYFFRHPLWTVKHQLTTHRSEHRETTSQLPANRYKNKKITYLFNELFLKANEYRIYTCTVINIRWFKLNKYKTKKRNEKFVTCEYEASIQFWKHEITLYGVLH